MDKERLFVIEGSGPDDIGLVGRITQNLAAAGANILDLRQDVLHGLFTIYIVADFSASSFTLKDCQALLDKVAQETNLSLRAERFFPQARDPGKKNLLLILVGPDKPGLASSISNKLSHFTVNIEFSKMIAREEVFLMELLLDISRSTIPLTNLEDEIRGVMGAMGIQAVFQREDVFNRRPRLVAFSVGKSLLPQDMIAELYYQVKLSPERISAFAQQSRQGLLSYLDETPEDVFDRVIGLTQPSAGTQELVQTLKTFGYRLALYGPICEKLASHLLRILGLDAAWGFKLPINPDSKRLNFSDQMADLEDISEEGFFKSTAQKLGLKPEDITVIRGAGIRLELARRELLELVNNCVITPERLVGLLSCFGI